MSIQLWNKGIYRPWTEQEDNTVIEMAGKYPPSEIAKAVNRSKRAVYCRAQFLDVQLKCRRCNPVVNACRQLRQQGATIPQISKTLGVPLGSVFHYLNYEGRK